MVAGRGCVTMATYLNIALDAINANLQMLRSEPAMRMARLLEYGRGVWHALSEGSSVARCAPARSPPSVPRAGGANPLTLHEAKRARPPRHAARGRGAPTRLLEHQYAPLGEAINFENAVG